MPHRTHIHTEMSTHAHNTLPLLCFRWDKQVISVREAKALPKSNSLEWRDKFICVEEPFDGTNTARAVHEKVKFDAIKAQFAESWQMLQLRKDLNFILPIRNTIQR